MTVSISCLKMTYFSYQDIMIITKSVELNEKAKQIFNFPTISNECYLVDFMTQVHTFSHRNQIIKTTTFQSIISSTMLSQISLET